MCAMSLRELSERYCLLRGLKEKSVNLYGKTLSRPYSFSF